MVYFYNYKVNWCQLLYPLINILCSLLNAGVFVLFIFNYLPEGIDTFNCCYTINTECNATIFAHHDRTEHESNVEKQYESMYIWSILDEEYKMNSTADWRRCHCPFSNVCVTQLLYIGSFVLFRWCCSVPL